MPAPGAPSRWEVKPTWTGPAGHGAAGGSSWQCRKPLLVSPAQAVSKGAGGSAGAQPPLAPHRPRPSQASCPPQPSGPAGGTRNRLPPGGDSAQALPGTRGPTAATFLVGKPARLGQGRAAPHPAAAERPPLAGRPRPSPAAPGSAHLLPHRPRRRGHSSTHSFSPRLRPLFLAPVRSGPAAPLRSAPQRGALAAPRPRQAPPAHSPAPGQVSPAPSTPNPAP